MVEDLEDSGVVADKGVEVGELGGEVLLPCRFEEGEGYVVFWFYVEGAV